MCYSVFENLSKKLSGLIILASFTVSENAMAQVTFKEAMKNYQDGRVISSTGDTLHVQINHREWAINPSEIELIQKDEMKKVKATDIKEFWVDGHTYRSATVDLDVSPVSLRHLHVSSAPTIVQDTTLFLLLLAHGKVNLYYLMDASNKKHFFYQKDGRHVKELGYYKHYSDATKRQVATKSEYKNQLKTLSEVCEDEEFYYDISYSEKALVKFFNKLNSCLSVDNPAPVKIKNTKAKLEGAVLAGIHHANYYFTENIYGKSNEGTYSRAIPSLGVRLNYIFRKRLQQFSLTFSMQYQHQEIDHTYRMGQSWVISDEFNSSNFLIAVNFRYSIPFIGQMRPYISAGPIFKYFIDPGLSKKKEVFDSDGDLITSQDYHFEYSGYVPGGSVGLGLEYQRFNFEVRYYRESTNKIVEEKLSGGMGSVQTNMLSALVYFTIF